MTSFRSILFYLMAFIGLSLAAFVTAPLTANESSLKFQEYFVIETIMDDGRYVALEDGSLWKIPHFLAQDQTLVEKPYQERVMLWGEGAQVKVIRRVGGPWDHAFGLWNADAPAARAFVIADLIDPPTEPSILLFITSIDEGGQHVTLSDGSDWEISWWHSWWSQNWQEGDMLVAAYQFSDDTIPSFLINADRTNEWVEIKSL